MTVMADHFADDLALSAKAFLRQFGGGDLGDVDTDDREALDDPVTLAAHLDRRFVVRAHLRVIGQVWADVHAGRSDRVTVATPPQVGKTTSAVEWAAFWWLVLHPTHRVIVGSYGDSLAVKRGRAIRRLVIEYGPRFGLFLDPSTHAAHDWSLTTGGGVRSVGVGAGITGEPGDLVILDDPTKSRAEAESIAHRERLVEWYSADILSRMAPGAALMIVQTRWHQQDLVGRVIQEEGRIEDGGRWRVIAMPALCTDPHRDPLNRSLGDPLPHPKIREGDVEALLRHWEDKRRSSTIRDWAALYQGDPKPAEGALLKWELLRERRCYQHNSPSGPCAARTTVAVAIDPSGGGRDTAGIVAGFLGEDRRLYLTHDRSGVMSSEAWARTACQLAAEVTADRFVIETNFGGDQATLVLRTAWEALRREDPERFSAFVPRIVTVRARRGKLLRAEPIAQQWIEDRVRTAAHLPDLESEWATWQAGSSDSPGRIDASVYLAYELLPVPASGETTFAGALPMTGVDLTRGLSPGQSGAGWR